MGSTVLLTSALSDDELESTLVRGTAEASSHMAWWLAVLAEFDKRLVWMRSGTVSASTWLALKCGLSTRTAREHLRVAHALVEVPLIREAFAEGRVTYSKVRVLCRVATVDNQEFLLGLAMDLTASQLERHVNKYEVTQRPKLSPADDLARRQGCGVTSWIDNRGLGHYEIVLPPEECLVFDRAIERGETELYKQRRAARKAARADGREPEPMAKRTRSDRKIDGLLWVLRQGLVNGERDPLPVDDPFLIVVHVEEGKASINADGNIDLGHGLVVSPPTLQRLCCNSMIQVMLTGADDAGGERAPSRLDLGRRRRTATRDQKVALSAFYDTCVFPGCDIPIRWCQFHHLKYWARDQGRSDLDNYRPLCHQHHTLVHEGGWELVIGDGDKVIATSPTGRRVQTGEPLTDEAVSHEALVERIDALGFVRDDADRAAQIGGRWGGARMTRWAESEIYRQLLEHCGGADPTADVVVGPAGAAAAAAARAMADEHFLRGEPPIAS